MRRLGFLLGEKGFTRATITVAAVALLAVQGFGLTRAVRTIDQPFPGFIVSRRLVVMQLNQPYWSGIKRGLRAGDLILTVDGDPVSSSVDLLRRVRRAPEETAFEYTVSRRGEVFRLRIPSRTFRLGDFVSTFGIMSLTGTLFLILGLGVGWLRPDALGLGVFAFSFALDFAMAASPVLSWVDRLSVIQVWSPLLVSAIVHFALVFPEPGRALTRYPWLVIVPYLAILPFTLANFVVSPLWPSLVVGLEWANRWLTFLASGFLVGSMLRAYRRSRRVDPALEGVAIRRRRVVQERIRITFWGLALAVVAYAIGFLGAESGFLPNAPSSMFVVPAWIWFGAIALASLRGDLFELGPAVRETVVQIALFATTVGFHLMLFAAAIFLFNRSGGEMNPWVFAVGFLLVAVVLYDPIRRTARAVVGWGMNSSISSRPRVLRELTAELASSLDQAAIETCVLGMSERLGLSRIRIFVGEEDGWHEVGGSRHLGKDDPLVKLLQNHGGELPPLERPAPGTDSSAAEWRAALQSLGVDLAFPLRFQDRCAGLLGFGEPVSGGSISPEDFAVLSALASQVAVALENARVLRRIRELEEQVRAENVVLKEELQAAPPALEGLVGQSGTMKRLYELIDQVAATDATVLLCGETGTGKELVARAIHARSLRRERPMIRVNCAAVPAALLESEFFGHERGAFTDAVARKIGRFELAEGGTIFLDEIGDLPPGLQPKLLRVLQEKEFERIGGAAPIRVDARVIAATNRDLEALVRRGTFREDLFFRLHVFPIVVPPLRERREDIPALVAHFLQRYAGKMNKRISTIEERSLRALTSYRWPGNVRELENLIERAVVLCTGETLAIREIEAFEQPEPAVPAASLRPLSEILRDTKVRMIRRALSETSGNQAHAATLLGLKPSSLSRMMRNLGLRG